LRKKNSEKGEPKKTCLGINPCRKEIKNVNRRGEKRDMEIKEEMNGQHRGGKGEILTTEDGTLLRDAEYR